MARKKRGRLPPWSYEDNEYSSFGMITDDMLKSKKYQSLNPAAKCLLITLIVHAKTTQGQQCTFNALVERYQELGTPIEGARVDAGREVHKDGAAFVFPAKHYRSYGYSTRHISKLMRELREAGFVEIIQAGKNQHRVNIYRFSTKWKRKTK